MYPREAVIAYRASPDNMGRRCQTCWLSSLEPANIGAFGITLQSRLWHVFKALRTGASQPPDLPASPSAYDRGVSLPDIFEAQVEKRPQHPREAAGDRGCAFEQGFDDYVVVTERGSFSWQTVERAREKTARPHAFRQ
jgi:hypothetical protein